MLPTVRPMQAEDLPRLREINPHFVSEAVLRVEKVAEGLGVTWRLCEVALATPFDRGEGYVLTDADLREIGEKLAQGQSLQLVAEEAGRLVALLDVRPQEWNHTAFVWCLSVDEAYRWQGLGRALMARAIAWAREKHLRALCLETQTNNVPACRFYQRLGMHLSGIRDDLYTNDDPGKGEVAIFWSYPLTD